MDRLAFEELMEAADARASDAFAADLFDQRLEMVSDLLSRATRILLAAMVFLMAVSFH